MKATPIFVFGARVFLCSAELGEELTFGLTPFGRLADSVYYIFDGAFASHVSETGEVMPGREAGFINTGDDVRAATSGSIRAVSTSAATKWVCVPRRPKGTPEIKKFELLAGQKVLCPKGARVFVAKGEVQTTAGVVGPACCFVADVDTEVTAITDVRGLEFL
jgi:hypothetical protein